MADEPLLGKYVVFYIGAPYPTNLHFVDRTVYRVTKQQGPVRCLVEPVRCDSGGLAKGARRMGDNVVGIYDTPEEAGQVLDIVKRYVDNEKDRHAGAMAEIKSIPVSG